MSTDRDTNQWKQSVNLFLTVLEVTAPVFLLASIGYIWVRLGFEYKVQFVTRLTMTLAVPALIFVSLMQSDIAPQALATMSLATFVAYGGVMLVMWAIVRVGRLNSATFLAPLVFGNTGNLGLPLALFAFGEAGLSYAVVVLAVMSLISFTVGVWMVSGGGSLTKVFREPVAWATVLGALFLWLGWETPRFLTNTLDLLGQIAIPTMLITLGVAVARLKPGQVGLALVLSVSKVVACAAIAVGAGIWFALEPIPFAVLVVQIATPVAVTSYLLAEKYGADSEAVAGLVVVSTLVSVVALPLILAFLI